MLRLTLLAFVLVATAACATDDNNAALSPLGNWSMTLSWGGGTCGITAPSAVTMTITMDPNGDYIINESDPTVTATGTVTCTRSSCQISANETGTLDGAPTSTGYNLTLKADGGISGSGSLSISGANPCSQSFTALGKLQ